MTDAAVAKANGSARTAGVNDSRPGGSPATDPSRPGLHPDAGYSLAYNGDDHGGNSDTQLARERRPGSC
jgi:hypothetical protein